MKLPEPNKLQYLSAKPFPNAVIDGIFDRSELSEILSNWPEKHERDTNNEMEKFKSSTLSEKNMGDYISNFIKINFQSQEFILFLEELTGFKGLVFDTRKFALHEIFPGGSLAPHLDYSRSLITGLQLRLSLIFFLNENWDPSYKGELELFDRHPNFKGASSVAIEPVSNRLVIFTVSDKAWHGHPSILKCPEGMSRKSIALNYFTIPEKSEGVRGTLFAAKAGIKNTLREFVPPILFKAYNFIK